jgi:hypothetical protein
LRGYGDLHSRDYDRVPDEFDFRLSGKGGTNQLAVDATPSNHRGGDVHSRDYSVLPTELNWKLGGKSDLANPKPNVEPNEIHPDTHEFRSQRPSNSKTNWKIAGVANSLLAPSPKDIMTNSAVDAKSVASFGFRKLDRFSAGNDWNANAKVAAPQEYSRLVRVKKRKSKAAQSPSGTPSKSDGERAALASYLDLLMSSNADVEDEIGVVLELLADSGCTQEEIAALVKASSGGGESSSGSNPSTRTHPSPPQLKVLNM